MDNSQNQRSDPVGLVDSSRTAADVQPQSSTSTSQKILGRQMATQRGVQDLTTKINYETLPIRRRPVANTVVTTTSSESNALATTNQSKPQASVTIRQQDGVARAGGMDPVIGRSNFTYGDALKAVFIGGPEMDIYSPESIGVEALSNDSAGGKMPMAVSEEHLHPDERYPGPLAWSEMMKWHEACERLDTTRRQLQGEKPDPGLCRRCRRLGLVDGLNFTDNNAIQYRPFGTWVQLLMRTKCRICRLIVTSLSCGALFFLHPRLGEIDPLAQFTQLFPQRLPSGEVALSIEYGMRRVGILRMVTPQNHAEVLRQSFEHGFGSPFKRLVDDSSVFHDKAAQCVSSQTLKNWISNCEKKHGSACRGLRQEFTKRDDLPILLIDVRNRCLVRQPATTSRYLALSYVWGRSPIPKTVQANFLNRQRKSSLPTMPKSIEDAIVLVQRLGERYLWVDAVCIVQDDMASKHSDIARMDSIYIHAVATIIALPGVDADAGLPGVRAGTRPPQRIEVPQLSERRSIPPQLVEGMDRIKEQDPKLHKAWFLPSSHATTLAGYTTYVRHSLDYQPGVDLRPYRPDDVPAWPFMVAHPPSLKHVLTMSPWNTRGWTLQERLLSRRCIYFTADYVYFQCGEETLCETGGNLLAWAELPQTQTNPAYVARDQETNVLLRLKGTASSPSIVYKEGESHGFLARHDFEVYSEVASMYSMRKLSFPSDAIHAVSGILNVVRDQIGGNMVAGLPTKYFDLALLWTPAEPHDRTTEVGKLNNKFPSWSWAAWSGAKQYLLMQNGQSSFHSLSQEFAVSEIDRYTFIQGNEALDIYKTPEAMTATEVRSLGSRPGTYDTLFPKYVPYSDRTLPKSPRAGEASSILSFWTQSVAGTCFRLVAEPITRLSDPEHGNIAGKQTLARMYTDKGKLCGYLFEPRRKTQYRTAQRGEVEFILISSFPDARDRRSGLPTMETCRPFDEFTFPWKGRGSGLVNIMLVERFGSFVERLSVAQIHRQAWEEAKPVRKQILLA